MRESLFGFTNQDFFCFVRSNTIFFYLEFECTYKLSSFKLLKFQEKKVETTLSANKKLRFKYLEMFSFLNSIRELWHYCENIKTAKVVLPLAARDLASRASSTWWTTRRRWWWRSWWSCRGYSWETLTWKRGRKESVLCSYINVSIRNKKTRTDRWTSSANTRPSFFFEGRLLNKLTDHSYLKKRSEK